MRTIYLDFPIVKILASKTISSVIRKFSISSGSMAPPTEESKQTIVEEEQPSFLYFSYGSNMLEKRIHINNPSAKFVCIGRLDNHRLDFIRYSERWRGASATIVPTANAHVWGAVWKIHFTDLSHLDEQEGVSSKIYFAKEVTVHGSPTMFERELKCRVYQQTVNPLPRADNEPVPDNRRPSKTYIDTIIKGAIDCEIPQYYIDMLKSVRHNNNYASPEMLKSLLTSESGDHNDKSVEGQL